MADIAATVDMVMIGTADRRELPGDRRPVLAAVPRAGAASCELPKPPTLRFSMMPASFPALSTSTPSASPRWSAARRSAVSANGRPGKNGAGNNGGSGTGVITRTRAKTAKPSMYKVLLLNDDYTPMEFVIHVLERFFQKNHDEATQIMLHVHQKGVGVCGVYPYEIAETKVTQVIDLARKHQHPLQCTLEKD